MVVQINQSIETNIDGINQEINKYLDEDFKQRVDVFFEELDGYLRNYRDSLRQAQLDQRLSLDQKKKLVYLLTSLVTEVSSEIKNTDKYLKYTDDLIANK